MFMAKVFRRRNRIGENCYRAAVQKMIADLKAEHGLSNDDLARELRCSKATISNALRQRGNLSGVTVAQIGATFGAEATAPFLALYDALPVDNGECERSCIGEIMQRFADFLARNVNRVADHTDEQPTREMLRGIQIKIGGFLHIGRLAA